MKVSIKDKEAIVTGYSFKSPTVGSNDDETDDTYYFCLKDKMAILATKDYDDNLIIKTYKIKVRTSKLFIKYDHKEKWERAGPIAQDKYMLTILEGCIHNNEVK